MSKTDTQISKTLSWLLRHGAKSENISITPDGFVDLSDVLSHRNFKNIQPEDIFRVVENDHKQRYSLVKRSESYKIKANQGHSMSQVNDQSLLRLTTWEEVPVAVHGTYYKAWALIKEQGLMKGSRNHIHFACTEVPNPGREKGGAISGFRANCQVLIYLNVPKALDSGIELYKSVNNVILSPGQNGVIKAEFFLKVIDRKTNEPIDF